MIDVFVRVWAETRMRAYLAGAVLERLGMFERARVHWIVCRSGIDLSYLFEVLPPPSGRYWIQPENFAANSRRVAEREARSGVYVVIDDDHLPIGREWLAQGVAAIAQRQDYAMLSSWSINGEVPLRAAGGGHEDDEVFEHVSTGTPYFVRRGTLTEVPDYHEAGGFDSFLSQHIREQTGKRIGFMKRVRHNHLGCGYSQVIPGHWGA